MPRHKRKAKQLPAEPGDTPTVSQLDKGSYERKFVTHVETNTLATVFVSSHDPVERWLKDERLSDSQETAILAVRRLWSLAGITQRVTATYGERTPGGGSAELRAANEIEAREDLRRIQGYFPGPLRTYFSVFENVCRHGIPAGVAGAELGYGTRTGDARAHQIVCFVADFIALKERW